MILSRRHILAGASGLAVAACGTAPDVAASQEPVMSHPVIGRIRRLDPALDAIIAPDAQIERLADGFTWSEGPVWIRDGGYLLFSDVPQNRIHRWSEADGLSTFLSPSGWAGAPDPALREAGSNGLFPAGPGAILLADSGTRVVARLDLATKAKTVLAARYQGKRFNSPNDVVLSKTGAVYFTDPPYGLKDDDRSLVKELASNGVYRIAPDGGVTLLDDSLTRPNGVGLSPDERTFYVAVSDPQAAILYAYDLDAAGSVSNRRVLSDMTSQVADAAPGLPDGMKIAHDGVLFATGPGGVHVITPQGRTLGVIECGGPTANCAFGGPRGDVLYMTSGDKIARVQTRTRGL
jgi:gluconolactonase